MYNQNIKAYIESRRNEIARLRKDIEMQTSMALCLLHIARNEEEIKVQQEIMRRLCEAKIKLNEAETQLNQLDIALSVS